MTDTREKNIVESFAELKGSYRKLVKAEREEKVGKILGNYDAAQPSRYRRTKKQLGGSGDAHFGYSQYEFWTLRELGRELLRNSPILGQAFKRAKNNILRGGMMLEMMTGDDGLDDEIYQLHHDWANNAAKCDSRKTLTHHEQAGQALVSVWSDGDVFANPLDNGSIQTIEGDKCVEPSAGSKGVKNIEKIIHGVELDDNAAPVNYWFAKPDRTRTDRKQHKTYEPDSSPLAAWTAEGDANVFHLFEPCRPSASRGVPLIVAAMDTLGMLDDLNFAKLIQAQVVSCIAAFIISNSDQQLGNPTSGTASQSNGITSGQNIKPGTFYRINKGDDVKQFNSGVPSPEHMPYVRSLLHIVCANIGIPMSMLLLDTSGTNFSGYRGEVEQARIGFVEAQRFIVRKFYKPSLTFKIREWLNDGTLSGGKINKLLKTGKLFAHKWQAPGWDYIEPLKDATADKVIVEELLDSRRGVQARRGRDQDDVRKEIIADNGELISDAIKRADELNKKFKAQLGATLLTWRDVLSPMMTPKDAGMQIVVHDGSQEGNKE